MIAQNLLLLLVNVILASGQSCPSFMPEEKFSTECVGRFACVDCHTAQSCLLNEDGAWSPFLKSSCEGKRPFCDPNVGTCIDYTPKECARPSESFTCIQSGVFPDPRDLRKYHVCENGTSLEYHCGFKSFDLVAKGCMDPKVGTLFPKEKDYDCQSIHGEQKRLMSSSYYVFCIEEEPLFIGNSLDGNFVHIDCNHIEYYQDNYEFCKGYKKNPELPLFSSTCDRVSSCINCTSGRVCSEVNNEFKEVKVFNCGGDTPYCEPALGVCVSYSPDTCVTLDPSFVCLEDGVYPHPKSTNKFYVCHEEEAQGLSCGTQSFSPHMKTCSLHKRKEVAWCENVTGSLVSMDASEYYVYCHNQSVAYVGKCPNNHYLDNNRQRCVPQCGWFRDSTLPDVFDCSQYYKCAFDPITYQFQHSAHSCPKNTVFDSKSNGCVKEVQIY